MGNKYRLGRKIGSGSFGDIYLGECEFLSFHLQGYFSQLPRCFGVLFLPVGICGHHVRLDVVERKRTSRNTASSCWSSDGKESAMSSALPHRHSGV